MPLNELLITNNDDDDYWLKVQTPFNKEFVADIKLLPRRSRSWNAWERSWYVDVEHKWDLVWLGGQHFHRVIDNAEELGGRQPPADWRLFEPFRAKAKMPCLECMSNMARLDEDNVLVCGKCGGCSTRISGSRFG